MTAIPPLDEFARRCRHASWFAMAGEALAEGERADMAAYLDALGLGAARIEDVAGWAEAEAEIKRRDWDPRWWEGEEARRRALSQAAQARWGERALLAALTGLIEEVSGTVHGAAAVAATRGGSADSGLIRAAAGAATMAAHQAAIEAAAGEAADAGTGGSLLRDGGRPFAAKFRLFEGGHWPLCLRDGAFFVL